jgi:spermidine synthase
LDKDGSGSAATPVGRLRDGQFRAVGALFLVSGAAGLVDQVCFSKYLSYIVGATAYAVSAVLAAFMTGLTVGAVIGGRLSGRVRRPLAAYGFAELAVGGAVALTPAAFAALTPLYVHAARAAQGSLATLSVLRWGVAMLLVVIPTIAMGATLPLVAASLGGRDGSGPDERKREQRLATLYAVNTLGGAVGAIAGAYVVLPALGLSKTVYAAASASAVAGVVALLLARRTEEAASPDAAPPSRRGEASEGFTAAAAELGALAFLSGFLVFAAEVVSTHLLAVIIGNSAYAFGLILAAFLACLFIGAALAPRLSRHLGDAPLATSLGVTALACAVTLPFWDDLPFAFGGLGEYVTTFAGREAMRALVAFGILALPATCMGLTFPLLLQRAAASTEIGRFVGRLTAINTVGAVTGALATGYVILPKLGSEHSLALVGGVFAASAVGTALRAGPSRRRAALACAALSAGTLVASPRWDVARLTAGTNVYFDKTKPPEALLHVREDVHGGITTVAFRDGVHTLYTNGKFQGNDGWELNAQRYFAHYPSLFVTAFDRALVIGLGTGTTLGTLATYPWRELDVVEISPAIVEAARDHFAGPNRHVLADPRVHVTLDDARNHLLVHDGRYHLISMELSSVWFAGASSLYSAEYYRLVRAHLEDDGIFQQWVQLHHVYRPVFAALVNTLRQQFEHVALFYGGGQGILVSSKRPLRWSYERARRFSVDPVMADTLPNGRPLDVLTEDILAMDDGLDRFIEDSAREAGKSARDLVSTDDNLLLEYETPRGNVLPWIAREALVATLRGYRDAAAIQALAIDGVRAGTD